MKKFVMFLVLLLCLSSFSPVGLAAEKYYYKGADYATNLTDELNKPYSSSSSVVVVTASTAFDGRSSGKERVRAFARCGVVKQITKANNCYVRNMSVRLSASWSTGGDVNVENFISVMTPRPTATTSLISSTAYYINNYYAIAAGVAIDAIINGMSARVEHSYKSNQSAGRVIFHNPSTSQVDVPSSVAYDKVDYQYRGTAKGVGGTFSFDYFIPSTGGIITARGDATYNVNIPSTAPYQPPLVIDVKTNEAILTHSIGI